MRAGLDRYLRSKNYPASLLKDEKFNESNAILEGKARALRDIGMGNRPNRSRPLTQQEETLWKCGQLGISTPMAIINTLWFLLTQHFGLRGRQEHHTMNIEDFTIMLDDNGHQYVQSCWMIMVISMLLFQRKEPRLEMPVSILKTGNTAQKCLRLEQPDVL